MDKRLFLVITCVCAFVVAIALIGCSAKSVSPVGTWYFESISPTEKSLEGLDDAAKEQREHDAETLGVFMSDSSITFTEEYGVMVKFLGDEYTGTWEESNNGIAVDMGEDDISSTAGNYRVKDGKLIFDANEDSHRMYGFTATYSTEPLEFEVVEEVVGDGNVESSASSAEAENTDSSEEANSEGSE